MGARTGAFVGELYDCVLSSGEMAGRAVAERFDPWHAAFVGNDRHRSMLDNPVIEEVDEMGDAEFVLCTGPRQASDTIEDYLAESGEAASRNLRMVCANPDREVIRGDAREICAGAIAERYETEFAGDAAWHGKPYAPVFDEVLRILCEPARLRVLVVGYGIHTDIAGATAALGITPGDDPAPSGLKAVSSEHHQSPSYASARPRWD